MCVMCVSKNQTDLVKVLCNYRCALYQQGPDGYPGDAGDSGLEGPSGEKVLH